MSRWTALGVMMTFFAMLPLDIDVPALNLCLMAVARWAVLAGTHDLVFEIYGNILGLPPESLPPLVARAIAVDSLIVFAILGFRKRRQIYAWWQGRQSAARVSAESLSSAP